MDLKKASEFAQNQLTNGTSTQVGKGVEKIIHAEIRLISNEPNGPSAIIIKSLNLEILSFS